MNDESKGMKFIDNSGTGDVYFVIIVTKPEEMERTKEMAKEIVLQLQEMADQKRRALYDTFKR